MMSTSRHATLVRELVREARVGVAERPGLRLELCQDRPLLISCQSLVRDREPDGRSARAAGRSKRSRLDLADFSRRWYAFGIEGLTDSLLDTVEMVSELVREISAPYVVAYGSSAGGYMALVLGAKLEFARVMVLSPQTVISASGLARIGDERGVGRSQHRRHNVPDEDLPEVADLLRRCRKPPEVICIYAESHRYDPLHVREISELPKVFAYPVSSDSHFLKPVLLEQGLLGRLLAATAERPGSPHVRAAVAELIGGVSWAGGATGAPDRKRRAREPRLASG